MKLAYNEPVLRTHFTEKPYPKVDDADLYVAVDGDDGASGDLAHPLATFNKAAERVRELKKTKTGDIVVAFRAGEYGPLSVLLTAEDSGTPEQRIIYCKYGDGDVVFNNGVDISPDDFTCLDGDDEGLFAPEAAGKIKKVPLGDRLSSYDPRKVLVLDENGGMTLARFPNLNADGTDDLVADAGETPDADHILIDNPALKDKIDGYRTTEGLLLYGYLTTGWYKDLLSTADYDRETGLFRIPFTDQARMGHLRFKALDGFDSRFWSRAAVVNVSEELDAKGEFWLDEKTGAFYVYDPSGDYVITDGGDMITLKGADCITFRGLNFKNSLGAMIRGEHSHGVTVSGCSFRGCAAFSAVSFRHCDHGRPFDITVRDCEFAYTAAMELEININGEHDCVTDTDDLFAGSGGVVVDNNLFTYACLSVGNRGALAVRCYEPTIIHNEFIRCYWEGIDFRGTVNMTAEYNLFKEVCYNGDDTGAVNNWSSRDRCGNVVKHNLFQQSAGGKINGSFALYLDDTTGTQVFSNLFYNMEVTELNNGINKFNTFCDNVNVNPGYDHPVGCVYKTDSTRKVEEMMADSGDPSVLTGHSEYQWWKRVFDFYDERPELKKRVAEMWPGFFDITLDVTRWREPEFCLNSSLVITGNREINKNGEAPFYDETLRKYSVIEDNLAYTPDENPLFVDPSSGDYRIRDDVDFPDIEFEKIGRY